MKKILLGCIADDFTGATDLANNLVQSGMRVVQTIGVPTQALDGEVDCVVVALKSRTIPAKDAVTQSLAALAWLQEQGAQQIYFKYCSTFDSTLEGNIGPVTDALMAALGTNFTIATPAFPENGRTVYKGNLFVGDVPLAESGMRNHPLTPMTDSNLVRVLQAQTQQRVGLIEYKTVQQGTKAIEQRIKELQAQSISIAIVDALSNADLMAMGAAFKALPLVTAGSGVAIGLPQNFGIKVSDQASSQAAQLPKPNGFKAIVSGSCSEATNAQVAHFMRQGGAAFAIDALALAASSDAPKQLVQRALDWAKQEWHSHPDRPVLVYATASPEVVKTVQAKLGVQAAGEIVEHTLSAIARGLVEHGCGQLIVAGGETSGACVQALQIERLRIGPQIAPGVPWTYAACAFGNVHLALKSGNFGQTDFFTGAFIGALACL